ncbi:TonB-dependent receptor [Brevundimonas sp.]|uniref:TonB-dependent receptor n=1 Tax=Brevundimonas sp. TaxID=1871086 RepID=UPI00289FC9ED|nr:TonB-dependent receptor [Brevundimonas sp.]
MTRRMNRIATVLLAGTALAGMMPMAAVAQSAAEEEAQDATRIGDIVVTAQRREERLIDVPLSVSSLGGEQLQRAGIADVSAIGGYVPNVQINQTVGGAFGPLISMRGLAPSGDTSLGRDQPVGLYIDGVPIAKSTGAAFDTVDLERVEVLRGPQGTLYGKNTIGGAVNLVTRKPTGVFGGKFMLGIGSENLFEQRLSLDLPRFGTIGEGIGAFDIKVAYSGRERDGFFDNTHPNARFDTFGAQDQQAGRIDIVWRPTEALSLAYSYDDTSSKSSPAMLAISAPGAIGPGGAYASLYPYIKDSIHTSRPKGIANDYSNRSDFAVSGHGLTIEYNKDGVPFFGDVTVKSITAHRTMQSWSQTDFDGVGVDLMHFTLNNDYQQTSQELQLIGTNGQINYTFGLFGFKEEYDVFNPRWNFQFGGNKYDLQERSADNKSYAAYGQLTWTPNAFEKRLSLTIGGRISKDEKQATSLSQSYATYLANPANPASGVFQRDANGNPVTRSGGPALGALPGPGNIGPSDLIPLTADGSWSEFTPEFNIAWKVSEDWNVYARYATGFKSGGNNDVAANNAGFMTPYNPEKLTAYEIGTKGQWFDKRLSLSAAVYYSDYEDFQAGVFVPSLVTTTIINAGQATMSGFELEGIVRPIDNLRINFGYGYTKAEYDEFILPSGQDVTDTYVFPLIPKHNYTLGVDYRWNDVAVGGDIVASLNYNWRDEQEGNITGDPLSVRKAYGLLDGRISLSDIDIGDGRLMEISLWGKNLLDEEYWVSGINLSLFTIRQWGDPRSFGLQANVKF